MATTTPSWDDLVRNAFGATTESNTNPKADGGHLLLENIPVINDIGPLDVAFLGGSLSSYKKTIPELILEYSKNLSIETNEVTMTQKLIPDFWASVDPRHFKLSAEANITPSQRLVSAFQKYVKAHNAILAATPDSFESSYCIRTMNDPEKKSMYAVLFRGTKGINFLIHTRTILKSVDAYKTASSVDGYMDYIQDIEILRKAAKVTDLLINHLVSFSKQLNQSQETFSSVQKNQTLILYHKKITEFMNEQCNTLEQEFVMKRKANEVFINNILKPKLNLLKNKWSTLLANRDDFLKFWTEWVRRLAYLKAYQKRLESTIGAHQKVKLSGSLPKVSMDAIEKHYRTAIGSFSVTNADKFIASESPDVNPFTFETECYLSVTVFAAKAFPDILGRIAKAFNTTFFTTLNFSNSFETKCRPLGEGVLYSIHDGILQEDLPLATIENLDTANVFYDEETSTVAFQKGQRVYFSTYDMEKKVLQRWLNHITVPKDLDVVTVLIKGPWISIVVNVGVELAQKCVEHPFYSFTLMGGSSERRLQYLLVYKINHEGRIVLPHLTQPFYGILNWYTLADNASLISTPAEKDRVHNTLYLTTYNLELHEFNLETMTMRFISVMVPAQSAGTMLGDGIKKLYFAGYQFYMMTHANYFFTGSLIPTAKPEDYKLKHLQLGGNVTSDVQVVDFTVQGFILAVGLSNGCVLIVDMEASKICYRLHPPKKLEENQTHRDVFSKRGLLMSLEFESNEELVFYTREGSFLRWKVKMPQ